MKIIQLANIEMTNLGLKKYETEDFFYKSKYLIELKKMVFYE